MMNEYRIPTITFENPFDLAMTMTGLNITGGVRVKYYGELPDEEVSGKAFVKDDFEYLIIDEITYRVNIIEEVLVEFDTCEKTIYGNNIFTRLIRLRVSESYFRDVLKKREVTYGLF